MAEIPREAWKSIGFLAIVGIAFIFMGLTIIIHLVNGDIYLAILLIACGIAIMGIGVLAIRGFHRQDKED